MSIEHALALAFICLLAGYIASAFITWRKYQPWMDHYNERRRSERTVCEQQRDNAAAD
jgi:hypothetical protein